MNTLIVETAVIVLTALAFGLFFIRMGQTPIVGYILAGVILGPSGLHLMQDKGTIQLLSEFGIMFLLFAIGLNLSINTVQRIWKQALNINVLYSIVFFGAFYIVGIWLQCGINLITIMTFCAMTSSTAVTVKSLKKVNIESSDVYDNTMGITILQDLIALVMIIAIKIIGSNGDVKYVELETQGILLLLVISIIWLIRKHEHHVHTFLRYIKSKPEILAISTVAACLSGGVLSMCVGLSPAFGAFISGLMLGNSTLKEDLKSATSILEETLLMVFFLSIGLLVNVRFITSHIFAIVAYVLFIMIGKTVMSIAVLRLFKFGVRESFLISVLLGHFGEFSFVLVNEGVRHSLLDDYSTNLLISITAVSLMISPFWLIIAERCKSLTARIASNSSLELLRYVIRRELVKSKRLAIAVRKMNLFVWNKVVKSARYCVTMFRGNK